MNQDTNDRRDHGFVIGLLTGTVVGAALALWLAPRAASELRQRVTGPAKELGNRAVERYQQARARVGETVEDLTNKGLDIRNGAADAVARGAHEVERLAAAARSDQAADTRKNMARI